MNEGKIGLKGRKVIENLHRKAKLDLMVQTHKVTTDEQKNKLKAFKGCAEMTDGIWTVKQVSKDQLGEITDLDFVHHVEVT